MYAEPPPPVIIWVIPEGGSQFNYRRSPIARDFTTSTFSLPYSPSQSIKKIATALRSRFKKIVFTQSNPSLLMAKIQVRQIFKRPWVRINLVIIVSPKEVGSIVTVIAIAWGETGINPPSIWDEQVEPAMVSRWVGEQLIPVLKKLWRLLLPS